MTLSVALVVVSYGSARWLPDCLAGLFENLQNYPAARIGLVENKTDPATLEETRQAVSPFIERGLEFRPAPANLGYGAGANWGWQQLGPVDIQVVLNPDMRFPADWLGKLIAPFERDSQIGIVGCKLLDEKGHIQHAGGLLRRGLGLGLHFGYGESDDGRWDAPAEVEFVTGAALAIRHDLNVRLGGFDPGYFPGYFEDVDLCWRARQAGYKVWYEAGAVAYHYEGSAFGREASYYQILQRNRLRFILKNFDSRAILTEFLPAEQARLRGTLDERDRQASARVYAAAARSFSKAETDRKPTTLKRTPDSTGSYNPALENGADSELAQADRVMTHLAEVKQRWLVEEKPFRSRLPFVASLRERFNSISTRWYVKPILAQQVEFNAAVTRSLEELSQLATGQLATGNLQVAVLSDRLLQLEDRLARIETLLEKLAENKDERNLIS